MAKPTDGAHPDTEGHYVAYLDLDEITLAPRNPKRHAEPEIRASVSHFGVAELPLLDDRTQRLVAGHGRIADLRTRKAAGEDPPRGVRQEGERWLVPVVRGWSSRSDDDAEAYLVTSNNLTTLGGWDPRGLAQVVADLQGTDEALAALTGLSPDDIADMLKLLEPADLDKLAGELGEPDPSDTWPIIRVKVAPHVHAAWRTAVEGHDGDEPATLAGLLEVDPTDAGESDWQP